MNTADLDLLTELQKGLPLVPRPYAVIGERLEMDEEEVLDRIRSLKDKGIIRRFRARINQRSVGITANALVAWKIPQGDPDTAGYQLAAMSGVTHCYRRSVCPDRWEYTHYTVHHGWTQSQVLTDIAKIAEKTGLSEYVVLFSSYEFKRTPHVIVQDLVDTK